tara:strand:+ start:22862 stop:23653 length:792 start_codon:yes stop_codon:yes gene_type:complete
MSNSDILIKLKSKEFEEEMEQYMIKNKRKVDELVRFLDNIETNKKYYRTGIHKNKKYKKDTTEDTDIIKKINSLINKLTDVNYKTLKEEIIALIKKDYIIPYIIENLIEKSILHHRYIPLYVGVIKDIHSKNKLHLIIKNCNQYYTKFFNQGIISTEKSFYENLCAQNKNIDNIIGLSILITYLEKEGIIQGYIEKVLVPFMNTINNQTTTDIEIFKMLTSFYNISEIYYKEIPSNYVQILQELKGKTKSSKIKFKIMDILGE